MRRVSLRVRLAALLALVMWDCGFGAGEPEALLDLPDNPTWTNGIAALLAAYCNDCHGEHVSDGSLAYFRTDVYADTAGAAGAYSLRDRLLARVEEHRQPMPPPPARPMSPTETAALRRWVEQGAPYSDGSTGGGAIPRCEPASIAPCACGGGSWGEQVCRLDGTYASCACEGPGPSPDSPLHDLWRGIFQPTCVAAGCHAAGAAYPDLETYSGLRDRLLQPSVQEPGMALVEPGSLAGSYLYQKLREDFATLGIGAGNPMPTGAPLSASQRTALETWIEAGAPE